MNEPMVVEATRCLWNWFKVVSLFCSLAIKPVIQTIFKRFNPVVLTGYKACDFHCNDYNPTFLFNQRKAFED